MTYAQHHFYLRIGVCLFAGLLFFTLFAGSARAALGEPTGSVIKLSDKGALFMVTFKLGSSQGDMLVPLTTLRSTGDALDVARTHYYIEDKSGDVVTSGTAAGLLLSADATYEEGMYRVPKDTAATFTLLVAFLTDEQDPAFRLHMRTLPFAIDEILYNQQYNKHELQYHVSGPVGLN